MNSPLYKLTSHHKCVTKPVLTPSHRISLHKKSFLSGQRLVSSDYSNTRFFVCFFVCLLKQGKGRKKERENNPLPLPAHPDHWDQMYYPQMCPDWELNSGPLSLQDDTPTKQATPARAHYTKKFFNNNINAIYSKNSWKLYSLFKLNSSMGKHSLQQSSFLKQTN